jgi:hypothetical protein
VSKQDDASLNAILFRFRRYQCRKRQFAKVTRLMLLQAAEPEASLLETPSQFHRILFRTSSSPQNRASRNFTDPSEHFLKQSSKSAKTAKFAQNFPIRLSRENAVGELFNPVSDDKHLAWDNLFSYS